MSGYSAAGAGITIPSAQDLADVDFTSSYIPNPYNQQVNWQQPRGNQ